MCFSFSFSFEEPTIILATLLFYLFLEWREGWPREPRWFESHGSWRLNSSFSCCLSCFFVFKRSCPSTCNNTQLWILTLLALSPLFDSLYRFFWIKTSKRPRSQPWPRRHVKATTTTGNNTNKKKKKNHHLQRHPQQQQHYQHYLQYQQYWYRQRYLQYQLYLYHQQHQQLQPSPLQDNRPLRELFSHRTLQALIDSVNVRFNIWLSDYYERMSFVVILSR